MNMGNLQEERERGNCNLKLSSGDREHLARWFLKKMQPKITRDQSQCSHEIKKRYRKYIFYWGRALEKLFIKYLIVTHYVLASISIACILRETELTHFLWNTNSQTAINSFSLFYLSLQFFPWWGRASGTTVGPPSGPRLGPGERSRSIDWQVESEEIAPSWL